MSVGNNIQSYEYKEVSQELDPPSNDPPLIPFSINATTTKTRAIQSLSLWAYKERSGKLWKITEIAPDFRPLYDSSGYFILKNTQPGDDRFAIGSWIDIDQNPTFVHFKFFDPTGSIVLDGDVFDGQWRTVPT
ncbi:hypothetical protein C9374_012221 [Naegleria lovaniensis]|uniref:Uncharacterized protein n=1 Tax=Naegleria lovaniensis TaxID=51637 RepID=A0AA88KBX6_NAELO|nr:uncharacterized protein C9374_012221 [Naegleria lovaniensis]KAG2373355.1 hypothetical protein C9374_012221 [Naegleria lovaniensis]